MKLLSYLRSIGYQITMIGPNFFAKELQRVKKIALEEQKTALVEELQEDVEKLTQIYTKYFTIRRTNKEKALLLLEGAERITASLKKKLEPTAHI